MPNLQAWRLGWECFDDDDVVSEDDDDDDDAADDDDQSKAIHLCSLLMNYCTGA